MALVVFTGGARSGKSAAAQRLAQLPALDGANVTVVVFGRGSAEDPEFAERLAHHRSNRPASFSTLEATDSLSWTDAVQADALLVVDCLGTLLGLAMEQAFAECSAAGSSLLDADAALLPAGFEAALAARFDPALGWLLERAGDTIVVTNEVGDGVVPGWASGRVFRDVLGRANRRLLDRSDAGYLCVAGRLIDLSVLPRDARWPKD